MASFYAELQVAGTTYPVRSCAYEFTQSTNERGRVAAKVRHGLVRLTLDVPDGDELLSWAAAPFKPLAGRVIFRSAQGGAALETLSWEDGQCVGYQEEFLSGSVNEGAYVCHLTIATSKLTMAPGGPASYVSPAAGEHGSPQQALMNPFLVPLLAPPPVIPPLIVPVAEDLAAVAARLALEGVVVAAAPVALILALILGTATPAGGPGIPQPHGLPLDPNVLRLNTLAARHAAGTLSSDEEAELIALLAKVKGIHIQKLSDLEKLAAPVQRIPSKFPNEAMPSDGKIIPYHIVDGNIKGINGRKQFDFVIDDKGKLIIGNKHHLLGNGQPVQAAGQLRLNGQGQIRQIDNLSGHYQPSVAETANYPKILENAGVKVKGATIVSHSISTNPSGMVTGVKVVSSKTIK
jgi:Hemolysin coregulated protein Hcp (TssD)